MTPPPVEPASRRGLVLMALWLTVVWVALWGRPTLANAVVGLLIAAAVVPLTRAHRPVALGPVRLYALARYVVVFFWMLVVANLNVTVKVLAPTVRLRPAVLSIRLPPTSAAVVTLVANSVTLTPGTLTLDARHMADGTVHLVVHALDAPDPARVRADVHRLHRLAAAAVGARRSSERRAA